VSRAGWPVVAAAAALAACTYKRAEPERASPPPVPDAGVADARPVATPDAAAAPAVGWLKGSTHVHARPSGDSHTPVADVVRWYEAHGYDFIVLSDHNRVTDVDGRPGGIAGRPRRDAGVPRALGRTFDAAPADAGPPSITLGRDWVHGAPGGLIVLAGVELTHNDNHCTEPPPPAEDPKCRMHLNAIGVTARPVGRIPWDAHVGHRRLAVYAAAIDEALALGGLAQVNHPQWHWGMTAALLVQLAHRGARLYEVANKQFAVWNAGDARHPSTEALWDAALDAGVTLWAVASDDAHDYEDHGGRYPPGGAFVMVHAARDPEAIKAALDAGRFYASTGVVLDRAGPDGGELVVEVAPADPGDHTIRFIGGGGRVLREVHGRSARYPIAGAPGYVRADVVRTDGGRAWVQPVRPPATAAAPRPVAPPAARPE